ncbi:glycosyltransferase family 4 protein [Sulfurimonas diazotrophicus]|uniref:Glycosyltransferase family 4 protein n=1 Tax=Sulfurimonas diazotrophicus TaxID=3131939 RepID=A0ABZ3HBH2_9BACT
MHKVCHLTSVHPRYDTRIFLKECSSLAAAGYHVALVVADGCGDEVRHGVEIIDAGKASGRRIARMTRGVRAVYKRALEIDAALYHFHDPELIPAALMLKRRGKKVVYDVHEDVPRDILSKSYLKRWQRAFISALFERFENFAVRKFDHIMTATPFIRDRFLAINSRTTDVNNFPILSELANTTDWQHKHQELCYIGGISKIRGIDEVVQAMGSVPSGILTLAGSFAPASLETEVKKYAGWKRVNFVGYLDREGVRDVMARSMAGVVTFLPAHNHIDSQPNKMFEYMSAGIPVIASNFPLWRSIIEKNYCGLCIDPLDPTAIANAMQYILSHPEEAERMGRNGREAVETKYNWSAEETKLMDIYAGLLS